MATDSGRVLSGARSNRPLAAYGPFWSMPSRFLTGPPAAAGIALVVTIANVGGFLGPTVNGA
jgi:ACS family tartrate transporter-like MFS transporter